MTADKPESPTNAAEQAPALSPLLERVKARIGTRVLEFKTFRGDDRVHLEPTNLLEAARALRDAPDLAFDLLLDVTAVDYLGQPDDFATRLEVWDRNQTTMRRLPTRRHELVLPPVGSHPRFALVYHLVSTTHGHRLRLKCRVPEDDPSIPSLTPVWPGANWLERETYDLYGINFVGHPDQRRIYLYDEFVGHPLRKDYQKRHEQPIEPYAGPGAKEPRRPQ